MSDQFSDNLRERFAAFLEVGWDLDPRFRIASAVLRGRPAGRQEIDDRQSLATMAELLACGKAVTAEQAARIVAADLQDEQSMHAAIKRLARKHRIQQRESDDPYQQYLQK